MTGSFATKPGRYVFLAKTSDHLFAAMNRLIFLTSVLLLAVVTTRCTPDRVKYTPELKQQMADMKIKRVTNADLVETVDVLGGKVTAVVEKELTDSLTKATTMGRKQQLCQLQSLPRLEAISKKYDVNVRLLGPADVQNKTLDIKEREVLDAYLYNAEQKQSQIANIQKINDTTYIYNAAVPTDNIICQTCFGKEKTPLAVWRLAINKREVVLRMNASVKKKPAN